MQSASNALKTIVFDKSVERLVLYLLAGLVMTVAGYCLATGLVPSKRNPVVSSFMGWVGTFFFGSATLLIAFRLLFWPKEVILFSPEGFVDVGVSKNMIPWPTITEPTLETFSTRWNKIKFIVFDIDYVSEAPSGLSLLARISRSGNKMLVGGRFVFSTRLVKENIHEVHASAVAYWAMYHASALRNTEVVEM